MDHFKDRGRRQPEFADLCGFREEEVAATLREIVETCGMDAPKAEEALAMMRIYYNGYNFIPRRTDFIYNPTLYLYFFKQFQKNCAYPRKMLDADLSVDQSKLEYVANLPGGWDMVIALAQKGQEVTVPDIVNRFGLSEMLSDQSKDCDKDNDGVLLSLISTGMGFPMVLSTSRSTSSPEAVRKWNSCQRRPDEAL